MGVFTVKLEGPEQEWEWREGPDYYDAKGNPRDGMRGADGKLLAGHAAKVKRPGIREVQCIATREEEAVALALTREAHDGYVTVLSVTKKG